MGPAPVPAPNWRSLSTRRQSCSLVVIVVEIPIKRSAVEQQAVEIRIGAGGRIGTAAVVEHREISATRAVIKFGFGNPPRATPLDEVSLLCSV